MNYLLLLNTTTSMVNSVIGFIYFYFLFSKFFQQALNKNLNKLVVFCLVLNIITFLSDCHKKCKLLFLSEIVYS